MSPATIDPAFPAPAPEALPRPVTPRARRQSWREPAVRVWWLIALVLALAILALFIQQFSQSMIVFYRLKHWRHQIVRIEQIDIARQKSLKQNPGYMAIVQSYLSFTDLQGNNHELVGRLAGQIRNRSPGETIEVLLNPSDPTEFSDRLNPMPLSEQLVVPLLVLPIATLLLIGAVLRRRGLLRLYQLGQRRSAMVVDVRHAAVAPRSSIVRVIVPDSEERRLLTLIIPRRLMIPQPDDTIEVITPPGEPTRALAVMLYE